jgi:LacI family transcriptional regulator
VVNNGPRPVAPDTAARVRDAIELLDYQPNINAQALRKGTSEVIGLVLSDPGNPFFTEFAAAIATEAFDYGHGLMIATARASEDIEMRLIDDLVRRQVDGLIVASVFARPDLALHRMSRKARIVWIDRGASVPGYSSIGSDSYHGASTAVEHLVRVHGHTSVGLLTGVGNSTADPRELGWQDTLRAAGLDDGPIARVDWSREGGYAGGSRLLDARNPPSAIFASSDLQAIGLLRAAHERGVGIPDDLAVIAFDGTKESEYCWPPLSVIAQPVARMAQLAVRLVVDDEDPRTHAQFAGTLITRQSCGCVPFLDRSVADLKAVRSPGP